MFLSLARKALLAGSVLLLFLALASPVMAQGAPTGHGPRKQQGDTPEIDPTSAISGITLLAGGVLLLADKFRMKK